MTAVPILIVIFVFVIIISVLDQKHSLRKRTIDATLRMREMELGLPPGTYSGYKGKGRKGFKEEDLEKLLKSFKPAAATSSKDLQEGIEELRDRLANLETIMKGEAERGV
ncbi:MAG TPA: hypothetical protein VFC80_04045 [Sphaerochaeta sp.]|nr:hypothetical protein [Sphaerochaeta sp.]